MLSTLIATTALAQQSRFELVSPFPSLPWVKVHGELAKVGLGQSTATQNDLQARILWIDATANISRYNTREKIENWIQRISDVGFNTVVLDVKPIVGYTIYPSKLNEQIGWWREAELPVGFDPLEIMSDEAKKAGLSFLISLNAFSEGHSYSERDKQIQPRNPFFKPGWGYEHPELQSIKYVPRPTWKRQIIFPTINPPSWDTPLAVYNKIPTANSEAYMLLDNFGKVLYSSAEKPESFQGVSLLAGRGEGATAILSTRTGATISFDSSAVFTNASTGQNQIPLMMNPHNEQIQERTLSFLHEILDNYEVDGILYDDRLRFGGLDSDFSQSTREQFEERLGKQINWPDDVFKYTYSPNLTRGIKPGKYYDEWLTFRAETLADWVKECRQIIDTKKPGTLFGIYAGSWYGDYQKYGNNYAGNIEEAGFPFLTRSYLKTGFANQLDMLITGCYYSHGTVYQALQEGGTPGRTVEAAGILSNRMARDQSWVYAGIMLATFHSNPQRVTQALQASAATTQGVMVFDLSHDIENYWPYFEKAFKQKKKAPHQIKGLIQEVRAKRADFDQRGIKLPPVPMFEGAPGTGF